MIHLGLNGQVLAFVALFTLNAAAARAETGVAMPALTEAEVAVAYDRSAPASAVTPPLPAKVEVPALNSAEATAALGDKGPVKADPVDAPPVAPMSVLAKANGAADPAATRRGSQVMREVCSACHGLSLVRFRDLTDTAGPGLSLPDAEALAQQYNKFPENAAASVALDGTFRSPFPSESDAKEAFSGALPLDLSLIGSKDCAKASYNPYTKTPQPTKHICGADPLVKWLAGNGHESLSGFSPLADGQVSYDDGTNGTVSQFATDIGAFVAWAAPIAVRNLDATNTPGQGLQSAGAVAQVAVGTRVALVIGNTTYQTVSGLPNAVNDADLAGQALRAAGFADVTIAKNVDRAGLVEALRSFREKADKADWALVYYAGHGIEVGGRNFLIPVDARLKTDRDIEFDAIPLDQVLGSVEGASKIRIVALDACRDNPFAAQLKISGAKRSIGRGLARVEPDGSTLVLFAAREGTTAADGDGTNSPFALAFAKRVVEPGVELGLTLRRMSDDVFEATGKQQEPVQYGRLPKDELYFVPVKQP